MSLIPGLIDCHVHIQGLNNRSDEDSDQFLYGTVPAIFTDKLLPYGVTTIKDLCAPRHSIYKLRDEIKAGKITGPELLVVGPNFTAPGGHPAATLGGDNPWIRKEMAIEVNTPEEVSAGIQFIDKVFLKGEVVFSQKPISSYDLPDYAYPAGLLAMTYQRPDSTDTRTLDVSRYADEGVITQATTAGGVLCEEEYTVERNLSCTAWSYARESDGTALTATKHNGYIKLSGTFRGKPQERSYKIGNGLWYQMMDVALSAFVASDEEQVVFYSIGTGDNRGALGLGEFQADKAGEETVEVGGRAYGCAKVSLVLTAFPWAWTGLFWYDKSTGQLVKSGEKRKRAVETNYQLLAME